MQSICVCGHDETDHGWTTSYCWHELPNGRRCQCAGYRPADPHAPPQTTADLVAEIEQLREASQVGRVAVNFTLIGNMPVAEFRSVLQRAADALRAKETENSELREQVFSRLQEANTAKFHLEIARAQTTAAEGAVGSPERDLRVIASRINAALNGNPGHLTNWCVSRLLEIAALHAGRVGSGEEAETRTVAQEAVEGVVEFPYCVSPEMREGMTHCAYVRMAKTLPLNTRVRVTVLPKEAE